MDYFYMGLDGKEKPIETNILAQLLMDGQLFVFPVYNSAEDPPEETVGLYVNCNDLFYWACADCEAIPVSEIGPLFRMHQDDPRNGVLKWCCKRRNQRPQKVIEKRMRERGEWDDFLESLPTDNQG